MKRYLMWVLMFFSMIPLESFAPQLQSGSLQRELADLTQRGGTYRTLDNGWVEIQNPLIRQRYGMPTGPLVRPRQPKYTGLPTLTVDLTTIDTTQFSWKYHYMSTIPVTGIQGYELHAGDLDRNGKYEVYGIHRSPGLAATSIYEYNASANTWALRYRFPWYTGNFGGVVENIDDIDRNGLTEIYARNADTLYVFEQQTSDSLPTRTKFLFGLGDDILIPNVLYDMNSDETKDLIFRGGEPDSMQIIMRKTNIAQYDSASNNFVRVWSQQLPQGCAGLYCTLNISAGEFNWDSLPDFVTSSFGGNVFVVEHVGGSVYDVIWSDSLSTAGRVASGDVDGNGMEEFFVGGTQAELDGYVHMRIYAYEPTVNDQYQPFYSFNIFPVGYFYVDSYMTLDIDRDGRPELLVSFGGGVVLIKGSGPHQYSLFYYKRIASPDGASAADVTGDGIPELFTSHFYGSQNPYTQTDVFKLDSTLTTVETHGETQPEELSLDQNYPNPFNPETMIQYRLFVHSNVQLRIVDMLGKEVIVLVNGQQSPGRYSIQWNGTTKEGGEAMASGLYLCQLTVNGKSITKKLLYLK